MARLVMSAPPKDIAAAQFRIGQYRRLRGCQHREASACSSCAKERAAQHAADVARVSAWRTTVAHAVAPMETCPVCLAHVRSYGTRMAAHGWSGGAAMGYPVACPGVDFPALERAPSGLDWLLTDAEHTANRLGSTVLGALVDPAWPVSAAHTTRARAIQAAIAQYGALRLLIAHRRAVRAAWAADWCDVAPVPLDDIETPAVENDLAALSVLADLIPDKRPLSIPDAPRVLGRCSSARAAYKAHADATTYAHIREKRDAARTMDGPGSPRMVND